MRIDPQDPKWLFRICLAIGVGYLIVGLWPFNFAPRNRAEFAADGQGLTFRPLSIAYTEREIDLSRGGAVTIELCLAGEPSDKIASIVSLYDGRLPVNLLIGQWKAELLLRTRIEDPASVRKYREAGIAAGLRPGLRRFVAISSGAAGTFFYVDGILVDRRPKLILRADTLRGRLILGDAPEGHQGWKGTLSGLAIYDRCLDAAEIASNCKLWQRGSARELQGGAGLAALFLFIESAGSAIADHSPQHNALVLPATYGILRKTVLLALRKDAYNALDIAVNILGFVPFGFFFFLYLMKTRPGSTLVNVLLTILAAAVLSAAIELIQVYLPTRFSQAADIVCNLTGAALGVFLCRHMPAPRSR